MTLTELIFHLAMLQAPFHEDTESIQQRADRMHVVSDAIVQAVDRARCQGEWKGDERCKVLWPGTRKALALLLLTKAIHESNLSERIHHNQCKLEKGECDSRRRWDYRERHYVYTQQSFSLWQLKQFADIPVGDWLKIESGFEGTHMAAFYAAKRLSAAMRRCGTIEGAIAGYAVGSGCVWKRSAERMETYKKLASHSPEYLKQRLEMLYARREEAETREHIEG